ncbi:MAG: nucleotidyl transferase AbiEii/AbiGii toxin family protein [Elusimicrobia bacterium]|nr:nucleotidyl transferase AbiEii/AbiGii toxin family protein [Elusimicrobiota bacterium]
MEDHKLYKSATAFRRALEDRLKAIAGGSMDLPRLRKSVAFERLLARFFADTGSAWLLKGGYALEIRYRGSSRSTKDMDFTLPSALMLPGTNNADPAAIHVVIGRIAARELNDWFEFRVGPEAQEIDGAPYGGYRFPMEAVVDKRQFSTFHFDVAVGDAVMGEPEWLLGHDMLSFAGIPPAKIALLPKERHFAEKIHAYTFPRGNVPNSRTRDLVDMVILIQKGLSKQKTSEAIKATFSNYSGSPYFSRIFCSGKACFAFLGRVNSATTTTDLSSYHV